MPVLDAGARTGNRVPEPILAEETNGEDKYQAVLKARWKSKEETGRLPLAVSGKGSPKALAQTLCERRQSLFSLCDTLLS